VGYATCDGKTNAELTANDGLIENDVCGTGTSARTQPDYVKEK